MPRYVFQRGETMVQLFDYNGTGVAKGGECTIALASTNAANSTITLRTTQEYYRIEVYGVYNTPKNGSRG